MDALYVFITTALPKAGAQVAGLPLTLNLLLTAYVILPKPDFTDDATIPRTNNSLRNTVHIWHAIHADGSSSRSECIHSFTNAHCCRITFGWCCRDKNNQKTIQQNHHLLHVHS